MIAVKGPELLAKFIGQSEENVRNLFERWDWFRVMAFIESVKLIMPADKCIYIDIFANGSI